MGIAMDAEGIPPAKIYYDRFKVTFPALVDPNYALGFGVIPHSIFIDENGVVLDPRAKSTWKSYVKPKAELKPVTETVRKQWSTPGARTSSASVARLVSEHQKQPGDLGVASELASRYLELKLLSEARAVLQEAAALYDAKKVARGGDKTQTRLLGQIYFQLSRACEGDRELQVKHATLSFYLHPTIGFGKQIARIIAPEKFDGRPRGDFDNTFREGTLRRLKAERAAWLK